MRNEEAVKERLNRYVEEKKRIIPQRSWESGYVLGIIDTLKWLLDGDKNA